MYNSDRQKPNTQKLAETLKRCGLASSVTQAQQMAGDITSTERKVQSFFDQKRQEMKDEHIRQVHPNREEFHTAKPADVVSAQIQSFREANQKHSADPVQEKHQEIKQNIEAKPIVESIKSEPKIDIVKEEIKPIEQKKEEPVLINETSVILNSIDSEKTDYITKFIVQNEAVEITDSGKVLEEQKQESATENKIEIKIADKPTEELKVETIKPKEPVQMHQTAAKPAAPTVDIHNFFNFQKKGKV